MGWLERDDNAEFSPVISNSGHHVSFDNISRQQNTNGVAHPLLSCTLVLQL